MLFSSYVVHARFLFFVCLADLRQSERGGRAPEDGTNASASTYSPLGTNPSGCDPFRMLTLRTGRWHECQCCNCQASPVGCQSSATSKRTHLLLVGSPCLHYCNTKPSSPRTNPPSNLRNQHCNRMAWRTSHSHRLDSDSPCHELCSTIPSWGYSSLLASLRNHRRNCKDRLAE